VSNFEPKMGFRKSVVRPIEMHKLFTLITNITHRQPPPTHTVQLQRVNAPLRL